MYLPTAVADPSGPRRRGPHANRRKQMTMSASLTQSQDSPFGFSPWQSAARAARVAAGRFAEIPDPKGG